MTRIHGLTQEETNEARKLLDSCVDSPHTISETPRNCEIVELIAGLLREIRDLRRSAAQP